MQKKSPKCPTQNLNIKSCIVDINFHTLGQILVHLKLISVALGFIKVVKSFAQLSHTAEILFSTIIKHKIKLSVLLYFKPALLEQHHFLKREKKISGSSLCKAIL